MAPPGTRRPAGARRAKAESAPGDVFLAQVQKHLEDIKVHSAREAAEVVGWLHTGNYALNWAVSGRFLRGWPLGHAVEVYGDPSTGKSYLIQNAIKQAQHAGGVAMLDDTEGALNREQAEVTLQINTDRLGYVRSNTIGEHQQTVLAYAQAIEDLKIESPSVLACDSLALLATQRELDNPLQKDMQREQDIKRLFRVTGNRLSALPVVYLIANHKISLMGQVWGKESDSSGGKGTKYQASIRLDLRTPSKLKDGAGNFTGVIITAFAEKNRLTTPWRKVQFAIPFYQPIRDCSGLLPLLVQLGILQQDGRTLLLRGEDTGITYSKDKQKFLRNDDSAEALLGKYPELLEEVDAWLDTNPLAAAVNTETGEVEEDT